MAGGCRLRQTAIGRDEASIGRRQRARSFSGSADRGRHWLHRSQPSTGCGTPGLGPLPGRADTTDNIKDRNGFDFTYPRTNAIWQAFNLPRFAAFFTPSPNLTLETSVSPGSALLRSLHGDRAISSIWQDFRSKGAEYPEGSGGNSRSSKGLSDPGCPVIFRTSLSGKNSDRVTPDPQYPPISQIPPTLLRCMVGRIADLPVPDGFKIFWHQVRIEMFGGGNLLPDMRRGGWRRSPSAEDEPRTAGRGAQGAMVGCIPDNRCIALAAMSQRTRLAPFRWRL
jgi:hypothetical protein